MEIIEKRLDELKPYEKNPRKNDMAVDKLVTSIEKFGFKVPIVIDSDGVLVTGHTRYKAAKKLKLKTVPCIVADDLTPEQIRAFRIADNKVGELAVWDMELLKEELIDIDMSGIELEDLGFADFEIMAYTEDAAPEAYDSDFTKEYAENEADYLRNDRVILCYKKDSEEEEWVKKLLNVEKLGVRYDVVKMMGKDNG